MPKPDAWMPLYIGDYRKDTSRLTTEQHGAYVLLIIDYWTNGSPPDDDAVLARICLMDGKAWKRARPVLERFFQVDGGEWRHKRIDEELEKARERSDNAADRARRAAEARWSQKDSPKQPRSTASRNAHSNAPSIGQALLEECPPPSQSPSSPSGEESKPNGLGRAKRLSPEWEPSPAEVEYAAGKGFGQLEIRMMGERFRNYWTAKSGKDATKLDWAATWRNWVLNERERKPAQLKRVGFV